MANATDTLVVLMAAGTLAETCTTLIGAGRAPTTPAAIVQWAWTDDQRTVVATLADLPSLAALAGIGPPATLVVGEVVALRAHGSDRVMRRAGTVEARLPDRMQAPSAEGGAGLSG